MGLLSTFKRRAAPAGDGAVGPGPDIGDVSRARTLARQRLIGAAVLVALGVVGFPLVFESQPRPIPVDIPIEIPSKAGAPALVMPPASSPEWPTTPTPAPAPLPMQDAASSAAPRGGSVTAAGEVGVVASVASTARPLTPSSESAVRSGDSASANPMPAKAAASGAQAEARTSSIGAATPVHAAGRFVVQVGAFAEAAAAREVRLRVEKLGLKTYTQVVSTAAGSRIRVRAGPFETREQADQALAKARAAGLSAVVLTL